MTKNSKSPRLRAICVLPLALAWTFTAVPSRAQDATTPNASQSQNQNAATLSQAQLQQLVAPIALYPDPLLTQILMASTYPLEVVEAARWSHDNPGVGGPALQNAMQAQSWDPSIKSLTAVPQTLAMMSDKIDWTEQLGEAFLGQQQDVLDAVQRLRAEAQAAGNLQSSPQQVVTTVPAPAGNVVSAAQRPIVIESVNPDVYYVPVYNPAVVYGAWSYPTYPPFYWSPPGFVASNVVSFAAGVAVGAAIWGGCDWWNHNVIINVNRYNVFNRTVITNNIWVHDPAHRGNVPYRNPVLATRFGRSNDMARDAVRSDPGGGRENLFRNGDNAHAGAIRPTQDGAGTTGLSRDRIDAPHADSLRKAEANIGRGAEEPARDDLNRFDADLKRGGDERAVDHLEASRGRPFEERSDAMREPRMPSFGHMEFGRR